jgi:hypothetical protein
LIAFLLLGSPTAARSDIFTCMDCTTMLVDVRTSSEHWEANCCNSLNGHCFTGDNLVDTDVGAGCKVSECDPDMNNSTFCISDDRDKNCPGTTGGGTKTGSLPYGSSCTPNPATGYCDVSCSSCG